MNIILTTSCNKGCSFCFATDTLDKDEMTLDDVKELLKKCDKKENIKLIGGEPTQNTNFSEILAYLATIPNPVTLISNFLFGDKIATSIQDFLNSKELHSLINVSEVNEKQWELVSNNISKLESKNFTFKLGYTINLNKEFSYYENYLSRFKEKLGNLFSSIRVSLPFPNPTASNKSMYFYKNYEYVDRIIDFVRWGMKNEVKADLDCGLYPCMIKDEATESFLKKWLGEFKYGCSNGMPADVINLEKVQCCYPGKDIVVNIGKHDKFESIYNELHLKRKIIMLTGNIPKECAKCEFLFSKCSGPCLGFCSK